MTSNNGIKPVFAPRNAIAILKSMARVNNRQNAGAVNAIWRRKTRQSGCGNQSVSKSKQKIIGVNNDRQWHIMRNRKTANKQRPCDEQTCGGINKSSNNRRVAASKSYKLGKSALAVGISNVNRNNIINISRIINIMHARCANAHVIVI